MNLLILGGTQFVGRHLVASALERGHSVATFTRGNNPLPGTESLVGDRRKGDYAALEGRKWDAVIDVNAYVPREVRQAANAVKTNRYAFISTVSVYQDSPDPGINEGCPLITLLKPDTEEVNGETYGGLKVLCDQEVQRLYPSTLIVRPHIVASANANARALRILTSRCAYLRLFRNIIRPPATYIGDGIAHHAVDDFTSRMNGVRADLV